jgi:hypothetical protein
MCGEQPVAEVVAGPGPAPVGCKSLAAWWARSPICPLRGWSDFCRKRLVELWRRSEWF